MSDEIRGGRLEVTGVKVAYGDMTAVWDAGLTASPGKVTVLLGRNGAGKTSLLNGIAGSLPISAGSVVLDGKDLSGSPAWKRARSGISLVQEGRRIFGDLRVDENLLLGLPRVSSADRRRLLDDVFEDFPLLHEMRARVAGHLSGGQQQLLAIAQAIAGQPRVLLVDEPSSGLSPVAFAQVLDVIKSVRDRGLAVVLVDQLVDMLLDGIADDVVVLDRGRVTFAGSAEEMTPDRITSDFLV